LRRADMSANLQLHTPPHPTIARAIHSPHWQRIRMSPRLPCPPRPRLAASSWVPDAACAPPCAADARGGSLLTSHHDARPVFCLAQVPPIMAVGPSCADALPCSRPGTRPFAVGLTDSQSVQGPAVASQPLFIYRSPMAILARGACRHCLALEGGNHDGRPG